VKVEHTAVISFSWTELKSVCDHMDVWIYIERKEENADCRTERIVRIWTSQFGD